MNKHIFNTLSFAAVLLVLPLLTLVSKKDSVSYNENRPLASFPKLSFSSYLDRSFMNGFSEYLSDHFIFREPFVKAENTCEKLAGKFEINGVYTDKERMIQIFRNPDANITAKNLAAIERFALGSNTPVYFALAPTAQEIYKDSLPKALDETDEKDYINSCFAKVPHCTGIDVTEALTAQSGAYLYYRTDHHWTTFGAMLAYQSISQSMHLAPNKLEYNAVYVADDFRGTLFSKTLFGGITADTISLYTPTVGEPDVTVTVEDEGKQSTLNSLFYYDKLGEKDKYSFFLGNNKGVITVENNDLDNGKRLLVIKDSYANCLIPFLVNDYAEITVVDPRYATANQLRQINTNDYTEILILYNVIGFSEEKTVTALNNISSSKGVNSK